MNRDQTINDFLIWLQKQNLHSIKGDSAVCQLFEADSPFRIICMKCGGLNIEIIGECGVDYGGQTGYQEGTTVVKCTKCGAAITVYQ